MEIFRHTESFDISGFRPGFAAHTALVQTADCKELFYSPTYQKRRHAIEQHEKKLNENYAELYKTYTRMARKFRLHEQEGEDLLQDFLVRAFIKIAAGDSDAHVDILESLYADEPQGCFAGKSWNSVWRFIVNSASNRTKDIVGSARHKKGVPLTDDTDDMDLIEQLSQSSQLNDEEILAEVDFEVSRKDVESLLKILKSHPGNKFQEHLGELALYLDAGNYRMVSEHLDKDISTIQRHCHKVSSQIQETVIASGLYADKHDPQQWLLVVLPKACKRIAKQIKKQQTAQKGV